MQDFSVKIMVIIIIIIIMIIIIIIMIIILYYGHRLTCLFLRPTDIWISGNLLWSRFILSVHYI